MGKSCGGGGCVVLDSSEIREWRRLGSWRSGRSIVGATQELDDRQHLLSLPR